MMKYSFIIPAYNEEQALPLFYEQALPVFKKLDGDFEVIFVNDGSSDKTDELIAELSKKDKRIKGVSLSRNFGQQAALLCGLSHAKGQAIVTMDADLQDPPEVAVQMIEKWKEGFEIVHARHKKRKGEGIFKRLTAFLFYRALKSSTGLDIPLDCGDFKLFDRKALDAILALPERTRLLRAQTAWVGFTQTVVEFDRPARAAGQTKYTVKKMLSLAKSGIIPNSTAPLKLPLIAGIALCILALAGFITLTALACLSVYQDLVAWLFPSLALGVGILSIHQGIQNIYVAETYKEAQTRPLYIEAKTYNLPDKK